MAFVILATFLTACSRSRDNRVADIKQCIAKGEILQKGWDRLLEEPDDVEVRHDKIGALVADCMIKAGYRHGGGDLADARCVNDVDFNPYCYRRGN